MYEKELLEIFDSGLEILSERRQIKFSIYKKIQKLLSENKIEIKLKTKTRIWCTKCDVDMIEKGIAIDCPDNGIFYICPNCNYRIVVF